MKKSLPKYDAAKVKATLTSYKAKSAVSEGLINSMQEQSRAQQRDSELSKQQFLWVQELKRLGALESQLSPADGDGELDRQLRWQYQKNWLDLWPTIGDRTDAAKSFFSSLKVHVRGALEKLQSEQDQLEVRPSQMIKVYDVSNMNEVSNLILTFLYVLKYSLYRMIWRGWETC